MRPTLRCLTVRDLSVFPEVPDLTHEPTVHFFRKWDQQEVSYVQQLRFIRMSSCVPAMCVVTKLGKHQSLNAADRATSQHQDQEMIIDENENILESESQSRFASTIAIMDGPL